MLANGIRQTTTTTGTGNLTLATSGSAMPFSAKFSTGTSGDPFHYAIVRSSDNVGMEWGIGHLSDSITLVRDKILATWDGATYNDQNPTAVSLAAGTYNVICADNSAARAMSPVASDTAINATNRYIYGAQWTGNPGQGVAPAANTCTITPFRLDMAATASAVAVKVTTAATTGTTKDMRAAIYRMDKNGHPGNKIAETSAISVAATGLAKMAFASAIHLDPGWYFIAVNQDGNAAISGTNSTVAGQAPMWGLAGGDPTGRYIQATSALTYADTGTLFPSPFNLTLSFGADFAATCVCPMLAVTS